MSLRKSTGLAAAAVVLALTGCASEGPQAPLGEPASPALPPALQPQNVSITNDLAVLEGRIVRSAQPLTVSAPRAAGQQVAEAVKSDRELGVRLTLVGTVQPPVVDGHVVQANDVDIRDHMAVVAYNFAGEVFAGAVQMVDFRNPRRPEVVSEVLYRDADVNAVALQDIRLFVGLASDDPTLASPALLEELTYTAGRGLEQSGSWLDLPSWAVTDLATLGNDVVAAVGARDGGVAFVLRSPLLVMTGFAPISDVRALDIDGSWVSSVGGGDMSALRRHALPSLTPDAMTALPGYKTEGAKGTLEMRSHRGYLGAGEAGFEVRAADGALLDQLDNGAWIAEDGRPAVTNGVSVQNHLAFVAAGGQGLQVVHLGRWRCDGREDEETSGLRVLGRLDLEDGASCNMVKAKNDLLVVAAGTGGVKLVAMEFMR